MIVNGQPALKNLEKDDVVEMEMRYAFKGIGKQSYTIEQEE